MPWQALASRLERAIASSNSCAIGVRTSRIATKRRYFASMSSAPAKVGPSSSIKAFLLQREMSAARAEVWRLKEIVSKLAEGKVQMQGADAKNEPFLDSLLSSVDALHKNFGELKESLTSLIELHMNVTSFEMNKFMKLLAIVGFLGLIPSVAGGLLGMNVEGNPWSVTLGQVAFGIAMGMAIALYVFAIKGWLR